MNARFVRTCVLAAGMIVGGMTTTALAQAGAWPWPYHYGYGWGWSIYAQEDIPYFSKFPPVYYSYPVPRPYGYSPFAYPPGVMTPEYKAPEPKLMLNPYVPRQRQATDLPEQTAAQPLRLQNPYLADVPPAVAARDRQPAVVYPATAADER